MSDDDLILTKTEGTCLTVTINRPQKANSLTPEMLVALSGIFQDAAHSDQLRAVIITGAGERVFCAGADLNTLYAETDGPDLWQEMAQALHAIPVMTLAAINGPCMGGGLTLALGCDIRFCVPQSRFSYPVLKNNVMPGQYDVDRLQGLVGPGRAAAILLGGNTISAQDAFAWGLADYLVENDALEAACLDLCATALEASGVHLKALKAMLGRNER
ncbi:enoyl-CoA hydratase/isomerase family protein [Ruegeria sp. R14_0]|uniref:enoyl-CoA hydratase/isomerase family protein n=1 Tax=Ruegeria sp. R14_0 TaxID=2821100 RepID=UPI001ADBC9C8|nr:enoyl-CoA hydratase/isomerase family protein [Ruegeria sp. R14_0]MBO9447307.1 enoyl-CoA hydratase/isomerase family protein [Ruegeria sp. R14_0]